MTFLAYVGGLTLGFCGIAALIFILGTIGDFVSDVRRYREWKPILDARDKRILELEATISTYCNGGPFRSALSEGEAKDP